MKKFQNKMTIKILILNQILLLLLLLLAKINGENLFLTKKIFNKLDGISHIWSPSPSSLPQSTTLDEYAKSTTTTSPIPKSNLKIFNEFSGMNNNDMIVLSTTAANPPATTTNTTTTITNINNENNLNEPSQIVLFNIGDTQISSLNEKNTFRLDFDQEKINYCHFDPLLLSNKRPGRFDNLKNEKSDRENDEEENLVDFNLNVYFNGDYFNETSKITGNYFI